MSEQSSSGWFFSPPVGPSKNDAILQDVLEHIEQGDDHWRIEAPASAEEYCRENWSKLIYEVGDVRVCSTIYYLDRGLFTVGVRGSSVTDWSPLIDPLTKERLDLPADWFDAYPIVQECWEQFIEVARQGEIYRYPLAIAIDREQLAEIVRYLFEFQSLSTRYRWMTEMEYARIYRTWFYCVS